MALIDLAVLLLPFETVFCFLRFVYKGSYFYIFIHKAFPAKYFYAPFLKELMKSKWNNQLKWKFTHAYCNKFMGVQKCVQ